jgi:3-oxoacyl-(acyl-carrier-protein) synthase
VSIVISGIGLATPLGCSYEEFWKNAVLSRTVSRPEKLFRGSDDTQLVSRVNDFNLQHRLINRQMRKIDRFSLLAISAVKQSIEDAKLNITTDNSEKVGMLIGNSFGGWSYVEDQMQALYKGDMEGVNAYISTAWFPPAAQGEISILLNIKGYSKTFSAGSISAGFAFEHASDLLNNGLLNQVIVGGVEAPLTQLVYNSCIESEIIQDNQIALCEGAGMFVFEKHQTAKAHGAKIYAEFSGSGGGKNLIESISACLKNGNKNINEIDVIVLNASGCNKQDIDELAQLNRLFCQNKKCSVVAIKELYGNAISANMAMDIVLACGILDKQCILPAKMKLTPEYINQGFLVSNVISSMNIKNILINGINNGGECFTLMLSKFTGENE